MKRRLGWTVCAISLAFSACAPKRASPSPPHRAPAIAPISEQRPPTEAEQPGEAHLTLTAAGDVTLGFHYEEQFDKNLAAGGSREALLGYGFEGVLAAVAGSDLFLVNLECPFTDRGEKVPKNFNFRARPELAETLLRGGVAAVSVANNHMMDYGEVGLTDTLATLDKLGLPHFGAGRNLGEARKPAVLERNGIKVALLGYLFLGAKHIEPEVVFATETKPGVAGHYSDVDAMERMVREDVAAAKAQARLVVPFFHWGREGQHLPEEYQKRLARAAIDAGAAAVLGAHPHVLQGLELYRGSPVAYSLGNFIFGGNWNPRDKEALIFKARFSHEKYLGAELVPVLVDRYPERPMQPWVPQGERARALLQNVAGYSQKLAEPLPELGAQIPAP